MGLLLEVIKKNAEDHPLINLAHCVNRRQRRFECRKCVQMCPKQVYDKELAVKPKWEECQNCGLCVTVCASRCIAPSPVRIKQHLFLAKKQGEIVVSCQRAQVKSDHVEACIALLPWEFMAYLALGGKLILNLKSCKDCPHEDCLELLNDQLCHLKRFLGEEIFAHCIMLCRDEEQEKKPEGVSRRGFLRSLMNDGKTAGKMAALDAAGESIDGLIYRRMLAKRVREFGKERNFTCCVELPWFSEKCYGCGICAKLCPNGAIEIGEAEDGKRRIWIMPHKCTACGVCKATCLEGGIEKLCAVHLSSLDRVVMTEVNSASCARCGRAIPRNAEKTYCAVCRQKIGKK